MKKNINNKGITLIVLVITIIILIIITGITVSLLLGENGIIAKAKQARELTKQAQENELISLNEIEQQMDTIIVEGSEYVSKDSYEELKKYYENQIETLNQLGDATQTDILEGKTALVKGKLINGIMKDNKQLNWSPTQATEYKMQEGYYSGGTLNSSNAYNAGYETGSSTNTTKTQTITQTIAYGDTRKIVTYTFSELTTVTGIESITSDRSDDYLSGYSSMAGRIFIISGNTVTICVIDGGTVNNSGSWTITAIGY